MGTHSKYAMVSVSEAQISIKSTLQALDTEKVRIGEALGRVLREDVYAGANIPAFAASLKDGYAVVTAGGGSDVPLRLRADLASHAAATISGSSSRLLCPGECAYVATGAPLPSGADAVAMVEVANVNGNGSDAVVSISEWPRLRQDIREIGSDVQMGSILAKSGKVLKAGDIGLLAGAGVSEVVVTRKVRVGVLSSGDEVKAADGDGILETGTIHDANRPMLLALIDQHLHDTAIGIDLGIVRDDAGAVREAIGAAKKDVDVLLTSGGVSMGARDFIKPVLEEMACVQFGRVNMKPGKPLTFASFGDSWAAVALPGNPVSAFVCFHIAAALAIRRLAGFSEHSLGLPQVSATLKHSFQPDKMRPEFQRAVLEWCMETHEYKAISTGTQRSSTLLSVHGADALLALPAGEEAHKQGSRVDALLLH